MFDALRQLLGLNHPSAPAQHKAAPTSVPVQGTDGSTTMVSPQAFDAMGGNPSNSPVDPRPAMARPSFRPMPQLQQRMPLWSVRGGADFNGIQPATSFDLGLQGYPVMPNSTYGDEGWGQIQGGNAPMGITGSEINTNAPYNLNTLFNRK